MVRRRARPGLTRAASILAVLVAGTPDAPVIGPSGRLECGNMRNATDAARLASPRFGERIAVALAAGFTAFPQQEFLSMFSAIAKVRAIIYCCDTREVLRPGRWAPGTTLRLRVQTSGPGPACPGTGPGPDTRNSRPAGPDCRRDGGESELCGSR
jgi:hypothetical protein